jgi:hypothetical protein
MLLNRLAPVLFLPDVEAEEDGISFGGAEAGIVANGVGAIAEDIVIRLGSERQLVPVNECCSARASK